MRLLVTGASGFIGRHVVKQLADRGHKPLMFDRTGQVPGLRHALFLGDIRDRNAVEQAVYSSEGVIHLAGILGTQETVANPFPAVETNILGGLNVFEACAQHQKRAVCITVGNHWMNNPYSISKSAVERFALMYNKERGTKIAVVRALNAYGPGQKARPVRKIIPNFILPALKGEPLVIYGDGSQRMDMIYVQNVAHILIEALLRPHGQYDKVFEAGTGVALTVNEIALMVLRLCASSSRIEHVPMRPGEEPGSTVIANRKTLAPLGIKSLTPLDVGLRPTIAYYAS